MNVYQSNEAESTPYNSTLNNIRITALAVDRPTVQKHAVDEITHWLTADTTLGKKKKTNILPCSLLTKALWFFFIVTSLKIK